MYYNKAAIPFVQEEIFMKIKENPEIFLSGFILHAII